MNWYDYLLIYFSSCILVFFMIKSCGYFLKTTSTNNNLLNLLIVLFGGTLMTYSLYNNGTYENIIVCIVIFSMGSIVTYKQKPYKTILNTMICYLVLLIFEILLSIIIMNFFKFNLESFNTNTIMKSIFTILDALCTLITCSNKKICLFVNKITSKSIVITTFFPIIIVCMIILDAKYIFFSTSEIYIGNIIIISTLLYLLVFSIITDNKLIKENEKTELLLNLMSKYEKIIDDNRSFKHELLNNLLILKSYEDKNSKEYNDLLDELIDLNNKKDVRIKNISNLPSGLKGIFYYKLYGLEKQKYNISINISKKIGNLLNNISHKDYIYLNKIISIVLDNAIEASSKTKDKHLLIDVYLEEKNICFDILNSYTGEVNLLKINKKGYSTKGKNRGLGLSIVNTILGKSNTIKMIQSVENNIFTTKIKVSL